MSKVKPSHAQISPFEHFFKLESAGGIALCIATVLALVVVNSPFGTTYLAFWEGEIGFEIKGWFALEKSLQVWVNDGLMAVFFFLIGLEIKRELVIGELNTWRKAVLPIVAAIGGMVVPIAVFLALNRDPETSNGWGIVMATDIAFALAVLKLLGDRIPTGLKVFLTAFAIADDLGAVVVVALVYSGSIGWGLATIAFALLAALFFFSSRGMYNKYVYFAAACVIWILFLKAGFHPTIAGVLMAFTIPISRKANVRQYYNDMQVALDGFIDEEKQGQSPEVHLLSKKQVASIDAMESLTEKVSSPLQHLEHWLHGWVAFLVIPIFALANAGVVFGGMTDTKIALTFVIATSLFVGKAIGVTLFTLVGVRLGLADLPAGVGARQVLGVSFLAGIGFTMSIFITTLAFTHPGIINASKMGILLGSVVSGLVGYAILSRTAPKLPSTQD